MPCAPQIRISLLHALHATARLVLIWGARIATTKTTEGFDGTAVIPLRGPPQQGLLLVKAVIPLDAGIRHWLAALTSSS